MVIETGLSDFHKNFITVIKMYYSKPKPTIIHYCKFVNFNDALIRDLNVIVSKSFNEEAITYELLRQSVNVTLEKYSSKNECLVLSEDPVLKITEKISTLSKY